MFILAEGEMWDKIYDILKRKAAQGVEVKLIFDDFGSIKRQNKGFIKRLRKTGTSAAVFNKIRPSIERAPNFTFLGILLATGGLCYFVSYACIYQ